MKRPVHWRRWLLLLAYVALTLVIVTRFANFHELMLTLGQGQWQWVVVAVALNFLYFVLYAAIYRFGLATAGVQSTIWGLLPVLLASFFVNAVGEATGAGGAALFVDDAVHRGQSGARAAVGVLLVLLVELGTVIPLVVFSIAFLLRHSLPIVGLTVAISAIFLLFSAGLFAILWLSHVRPLWVTRVLEWMQRVVNRIGSWFHRPRLLSEDWARRNAADFTAGALAVTQHPTELGLALLYSFLLHLINVAQLYALCFAFLQPVSLGLVLTDFSIGFVVAVVVVFPPGAVEAIMALILVDMNLNGAEVGAIILSFRGLSFWLPLLVGFFFFSRVVSSDRQHHLPSDEKKDGNSAPSSQDDDSEPPVGTG